MIIAVLIVIGLSLGSFVNALVWRTREEISISRGRSMCPDCKHTLAAKDLLPVISWLSLGGKCRYCSKPISPQYPLVELATAALFVTSYAWWPMTVSFDQLNAALAGFILWLVLLVGLMALLVFDMRWQILPNRFMSPLAPIALLFALLQISASHTTLTDGLLNIILSVLIGGGLFYILFQMSKGKWIGGGDVKLGALLGIIVGTPGRTILFIFLGSLLGSLVSMPLLASGRMKRTSALPFGPFLIAGAIITVFFGADMLHWYREAFLKI